MAVKTKHLLLVLFLSIFFIASSASALPVRKVVGGYCIGKTNAGKKFEPAQKVGNQYQKMSSSNTKFAALDAKCKKLVSTKLLKFKNMPSMATVFAAPTQNNTNHSLAVIGTPPTLTDLSGANITDVFFVPEVADRLIAGTPTDSDCAQVFSSSVDGESGGLSACRSAQQVGEAMGTILQSETSVCYMRGFPAAAANNSGVAEVVSGSLPTGGWNALFNTPETQDRLVKISVQLAGDAELYIQVKSAAANLNSGHQYRASFYACLGSQSPQEAQTISLRSNGIYSIKSVGDLGIFGAWSASVMGKIAAEAQSLAFDPSATRSVQMSFVAPISSVVFKNDVTIDPDKIISKHYSTRGSEVTKSYSVANYSGDDISTLRFLSGAFRDELQRGPDSYSFSGGTEYRDTGYRAAPYCPLIGEVPTSLDDQFYSDEPTEPEPSNFNCDTANPDIEISLNIFHPAMVEVAVDCLSNVFETTNFCETAELQDIMDAYFNYCS